MTTAFGPAALAAGLCLLLAACGPAPPAPVREAEAHQAAPPQPPAPEPARAALTGRVVDGANILSPATETELASLSAGLEQRRTDQLVVVTVQSLEGQEIERYSLEHFNARRIGRADVNNGVMILIAPNERKVRIETGRGTRTILSDEACRQIIDTQMMSHFRELDFDTGVLAGARAIVAHLDRSPPWPAQPAPYREPAQ